ncbi:MAG TPA: 2'-5' RNA ligase family protein [Candidatus Saccharimonadales bacterium]|nr:2'-5' RNA ligase family protein [Candidatus Saccharimonadales bacterium]
MKYNYYIGIQIPAPLRQKIQQLQSELFDPIECVEPLEPHITLLPPPCVGDINPDHLSLHVKAAAESGLPFDVSLTDVVTFKGRTVAFKAESSTLHDLQQQLVELLPFEADEVEYFPEPKFTPHITLVQALRGRTLPAKLVQEYKAAARKLLPASFTVDHLTLFERERPRKYRAKPI